MCSTNAKRSGDEDAERCCSSSKAQFNLYDSSGPSSSQAYCAVPSTGADIEEATAAANAAIAVAQQADITSIKQHCLYPVLEVISFQLDLFPKPIGLL